MKIFLAIVILCISATARTSGHKENTQADSTKKVAELINIGPFDLAAISLKEKDAPRLLAARQVKSEPVSNIDQTLYNYEVFKTAVPTYFGLAVRICQE